MSRYVFPGVTKKTIVSEELTEPSQNIKSVGLTKRELFAAMAMQGFLAMNQPSEERGKEAPNIISKASVIMADALIAELDKERE